MFLLRTFVLDMYDAPTYPKDSHVCGKCVGGAQSLKFKCYAILEKHKREFSITVKRVSEYRS
jgi:hypothetical protein